MALLHFITGKGGVGRSTVAAAFAMSLSEKSEGPVLLLEVQGSGRSLQLCGLNGPKPFTNTALPDLQNSWGARLLPKESFRQYFSLLLSLGNENSSFATVTSSLRERIVDTVIDNNIVSAFIDVCPGIEPAVLLGKIHFEASDGRLPESQTPWKHVVVDAPATGHSLMLFRSTDALREVFATGPINKQASSIMSFVRDSRRTRVYVVATPDELPIRETLDLRRNLAALDIRPHGYFLNRCLPKLHDEGAASKITNQNWAHEVEFERETAAEQQALMNSFRSEIGAQAKLWTLPEIFRDRPEEIARKIAKDLNV